MAHRWARAGVVTVVIIRQEVGAPALDLDELGRWLRDAAVAAIVDDAPWPLEAAAAMVIPDEEDVLDVFGLLEALPPAMRDVHWGPAEDRVTTVVSVPTLVAFPPDASGPLLDEARLYAHEAVCTLEPNPAWLAEWRVTSVPLASSELEAVFTAAREWVASEGFTARFGAPWGRA